MSILSRLPRRPSLARQSLHKRRRSQAGTRRSDLERGFERLEERALLAAELDAFYGLIGPGAPGLADEASTATILWQGGERAVSAGRWIVALDGLPGAAALQLDAAANAFQQRAVGPAVTALRSLGGGSLLIDTAPDVTYTELQASLASLRGFRYLEPDFVVGVDASQSNDPRFSGLYGLNNAGQTGGTLDADIDAPEAWDLTIGSSSIIVGVIDTGIDYNHPDLAANIWTNPGEIAGDGIDNDGNGYTDDIHGYDFVNSDGDPLDDNGHGTHVSGTIGASGNNALGVTGVNWQVQIMGLKFLGAGGSGSTSAAISAVNYATMMRNTYGVNIRVTNNSWGGGAFSQALSDAIAASGNAGISFVASAGNSAANTDAAPSYPASYDLPNVISVAATDSNDVLASFSNYGATSVDLAAPGVNILSTYLGNTYASLSGTSMAAPHVTGVVALASSLAPSATAQQIRDAVLAGVDALPGLSAVTVTGGRLNARNALNALAGDEGDTLAAARVTRLAAPAPGDHYFTPNTILGDGAFGSRDVDLYQFSAPAGSTLTAVTGLPEGGSSMDTFLRLFDSAGAPLAANDDFGGQYSRVDYTFATAGAYYVGVSGSGNSAYDPTSGGNGVPGSTGDYRLDLSLDIGDTLGNATLTGLVGVGAFAQPFARIGDGHFSNRDVDLYQFSAPANSLLLAKTSESTVGAAMDTVLRLFDSSGTPLAINQHFTGLYSQLYYRLTAAGTYYLGVSGSGNSAYDPTIGGSEQSGSTGDYTLNLNLSVDTHSAVEFELSSLVTANADGSDGFVVNGIVPNGALGSPRPYQPIGDVNQDGTDDLLLAAQGAGLTHVYLIFGRPGGFPANFDLQSLDGTTGYVIEGAVAGDAAGFRAGGGGDVNGDGIPDVALGAQSADPSSDRLNAGQTFVLYGGAAHLALLDLADGAADGRIGLGELDDGAHGFVINGVTAGEGAGFSTVVPDVNADGVADLFIGAPLGAPLLSGRKEYVVFGRTSANPFPAVFELSSLNGSNGFVITGSQDAFAGAEAWVGDVNGDGIGDLITEASLADVSGRVNAGQVYVIFGRPSFPATFDVSSLNGTNGFTINGNAANDSLGGFAVDGAGDINADGVDDILIGAYGVDNPHGDSSGAAYVIFGKVTATSGSFPAFLDVSTLNGSNGFVLFGISANDMVGAWVSGPGDVNGDGYDDMLIQAAQADMNGATNSGQTYVVYGGASFGPSFELGSLLSINGGDGSAGYVLNGFVAGSFVSNTVFGVGDVNADGYADFRIVATGADVNGLNNSGQAYIIYGKPSPPAIRVLPASGLVTTESGGTAQFYVMLSTQPTANVTISVSSGDPTEATVSSSALTFTPANWNVAQAVTVTGVNDTVVDGDIAYTIVVAAAVSSDPNYQGLNPADVSVVNLDDDATKFYVVNDATQNQTYEYNASGGLVESYSLNSGNTAPRGAASSIAGDKIWVVDANRKVYVYNAGGGLLGSWTAGTLASNATVEGITVNGADVWIVDGKRDKVFKYAGAATRLSGSQTALSSFSLNGSNNSPKDLVTDGASIWVVNDSSTDKVFKYSISGSLLGSWTISSGGGSPTGITINPTNVSNIWIVDSASDKIYQFNASASRTSGSQAPAATYPLAAGNTNPQGIADPPAGRTETGDRRLEAGEPAAVVAGDVRVPAADVEAGSVDLISTASHGVQASERPSDSQRVVTGRRGVDAFMNRLGRDLGSVPTATTWAAMTADTMTIATQRRTALRNNVQLQSPDGELDAALESIAHDLVAMRPRRRGK